MKLNLVEIRAGTGLILGPQYIDQLPGPNFQLPGWAFFKARKPKNNLNA